MFEPELFAGPLYYDPRVGGYCIGPRAKTEAEPMALPTCATCRYFVRFPENVGAPNFGDCRRHAPERQDKRIGSDRGAWPYTHEAEGCGDHEPARPIDANG